MVKYFLFTVFIFTAFACSEKDSNMESLLTSNGFNNSEAQEIKKLVDYFETETDINKSDLKKSYILFMDITALSPDSLANQIFNKTEFRQQINNLPKSVKSDLWQLINGTAYMSYDMVKFKEPINYKSLDIKTSGRYINLLKSIPEKEVQNYVEDILKTGGLPTSFTYRSLVINFQDKKTVDFIASILYYSAVR